MDTKEIVHRLVEGATKQVSRRLPQGWDAIKPIGPLASLPGIANRMRNCQPDLAAVIAREAEDVRAGQVPSARRPLAGTESHAPSADFWHIDPDDGEVFPQRDAYCFDVSFRHGVNTREIKRIWELNRLQFLVPLAAYAALSGDQSGFELGRRPRPVVDGRQPSLSRAELGSGIELALRAHFGCAMPLHDRRRAPR